MSKELTRFLMFMRPAFSRQATHVWFVIVFVGLLVRNDMLGVSSIIRALSLAPERTVEEVRQKAASDGTV